MLYQNLVTWALSNLQCTENGENHLKRLFWRNLATDVVILIKLMMFKWKHE